MLGLGTLARVTRELRQDLTAAQERDPAARGIGRLEILLTYGGVQALLAHRVAHAMHEAGVPVVPHAVSNASRVLTGVEIHPAARIGDALFIDHGAGVVIGETAEIGDNVTLNQGVMLGGTGFARGKRIRREGRRRQGPGPSCSGRSTWAGPARSARSRPLTMTCRRGRPSLGNPGIRRASTDESPRGRTRTGHNCRPRRRRHELAVAAGGGAGGRTGPRKGADGRRSGRAVDPAAG